jgi:hypothetical protein
MTDNNETQNDHNQSSTSLQTPINLTSDLSDNFVTSIKGVRFVNAHEMTFIQAHRIKYPDIPWNPHTSLPSAKPSSSWFSNDYPWLRAVRKDNNYGLLCADCAEFASNEMAIKRNNGAFVVRPYWKLKHKGLEGKNISFYNINFHKFLLIRNSRTQKE